MDAAAWDERYGAAEMVWSAEPNRFVVEVVEGWPPGRALDLACGEGRNSIWLARRDWVVTAVDFSRVAIDRGRELAEQAGVEVDWVCADVAAHDEPPMSVDLALLCYLQLPAAELAAVIERAKGWLAPGGAIVVIAHALDNLEHGVGGPQDPAVLPTPEQVTALLEGLDIERAGHVTRPVDGPAGRSEAVDLVVVGRLRVPGS